MSDADGSLSDSSRSSRSSRSSPTASGTDSSVALSLPESFEQSDPLVAGPGAGLGAGAPGAHAAARAAQLEGEVAHLRRARRLLEDALHEERASNARTVQRVKEAQQVQLRAAREERDALERARAHLEKQLALRREDLAGLAVSDVLAEELQRVPESDLTLKEWVQLRVHRATRPAREAQESLRRQLQDTREQLAGASAAAEEHQREAARARRLAAAREEGLEVELAAERDRCRLASAQLKAARREVSSLSDKGARFDGVARRAEELEREAEGLRRLSAEQQSTLAEVHGSAKALTERSHGLEQRAEALALDKAYLERRLSDEKGRADRGEAQLAASLDALRSAERRRSEAVEELVEVQRSCQAAYDERLQQETARLRGEAEAAARGARQSVREGFEREVAALREAAADLASDRDHWRRRAEELGAALDRERVSLGAQAAESAARATEAEGRAKMRAFEAAQLGARLESEEAGRRRCEAEGDVLRKKLAVHEQQFAQMEATSAAELHALREALARERARSRRYEDLEAEVDSAIVASAAKEDAEGALCAIAALPTAPQARVRQAVGLAQRLLAREAALAAAEDALQAERRGAAEARRKAEALEAALSQVAQPQRLVVEALRRSEEEKRALGERCEALRLEVERGDAQRDNLQEELRVLRGDLEALLAQREQLEQMRSALQDLRASGAAFREEGSAPRSPLLPHSPLSPASPLSPLSRSAAPLSPATSTSHARVVAVGQSVHNLMTRHSTDA